MIASILSAALVAAIPFRGVVEGFYGRPWGTEGRLSMIEFMGERDLNTFVYGPKDDPYHHARWREPYPAEQMADFSKVLAAAKRNRVDFYWAIHLGGSMAKEGEKNAADWKSLFAKLEFMYAGGFRAFAIFFDDFGDSDAKFHAEVCNRVIAEFLRKKGDCAPLLVCPHDYWTIGKPYQKTIGELLDPSANIMWTGRGICCDISAKDISEMTAVFRRKPFVWWNWPVNDYCRKKVLLGRLYGLAPADYAGIVINPMENCEANKISVHSFAEWAKDPEKFDSVRTWNESFAKLYSDPEVARAMRVFAEHNADPDKNSHNFRREESASAKGVTDPNRLKSLFTEVAEACDVLLAKLPKANPRLYWELEGWIRDERLLMSEGLAALELGRTSDAKVRAQLIDEIAVLRGRRAVNGDRHIVKFAAATFKDDRRNQVRSEASTSVLSPLVQDLVMKELEKEN